MHLSGSKEKQLSTFIKVFLYYSKLNPTKTEQRKTRDKVIIIMVIIIIIIDKQISNKIKKCSRKGNEFGLIFIDFLPQYWILHLFAKQQFVNQAEILVLKTVN